MYMHDIALACSYLHTRRPSIIHRVRAFSHGSHTGRKMSARLLQSDVNHSPLFFRYVSLIGYEIDERAGMSLFYFSSGRDGRL